MKKLLILILSLLPYIGFAFEQVQFPQAQFQSTSSCKTVTGYVPQITEVGASSIYESSSRNIMYMKKGNRPDTDDDPFATPIGDIPMIFLICFICIFLFYKQRSLE